MKTKINQNLLLEFSSVFFAVFLGLMLNQWNDNRNNNKLAGQSKNNILSEILENNAKVQNMLASHQVTYSKVDSLLGLLDKHGDPGDISLELNIQLLSSTSWETAKLTQAIAYMDIELVTDIARIYNGQDYYQALIKDFTLRNMYMSPDNSKKESMEELRNLLDAVIPIETSLLELYSQIQTDIHIQ